MKLLSLLNKSINVSNEYINEGNYVLQVYGNSMIDDNILNGDYVIVKKTDVAFNGNIIVAILNNEATLKRYYIGKKNIDLHPQNLNYDIIHVNEGDDFQINGIVLAILRKYI